MPAASAATATTEREPVLVDFALQGGGAHGAFTWGVLDYLLEDGRLHIDGNLPGLKRAVFDRLLSFTPFQGSPAEAWFGALSRYLSPYDINPLNINPLRDVIERFVDFEAVRACKEISLFISATNVHTGRVRIFPQEALNADVVMASACLPFLFRAVEIDGVPYWDGGYMGNPAIFPFFDATHTEDVLIVQINPLERTSTPHTHTEIMNRINEITFNSSLQAEFRAIDFVTRLINQGRLPHGTGEGEYRRINVHRIPLDATFKSLTASSKLNSDFDFFESLFRGGRKAARIS